MYACFDKKNFAWRDEIPKPLVFFYFAMLLYFTVIFSPVYLLFLSFTFDIEYMLSLIAVNYALCSPAARKVFDQKRVTNSSFPFLSLLFVDFFINFLEIYNLLSSLI